MSHPIRSIDEVVINGVRYVPAVLRQQVEEGRRARLVGILDTVVETDAGKVSIRDFLRLLMTNLLRDPDDFSGKRPFGNSGWKYNLIPVLIRDGIVTGSLDEDGYVENVDDKEVDKVFDELVAVIFGY